MSQPGTPRRPAGALTRYAIVAIVSVVGIFCLVAASIVAMLFIDRPLDGDELARDDLESAASRLATDLGQPRTWSRDAEAIAGEVVWFGDREMLPTRVEPVAWSGYAGVDEQATVDVRFTVELAEHLDNLNFGERGHTAGSATRCLRYVVQFAHESRHEELPCPPVSGSPDPRRFLQPDADQRLEEVLRRTTPESLATDVAAMFPSPWRTVDTTTNNGELVAAVGLTGERDCLIEVRRASGKIYYTRYDRAWLEPGGVGCTVALYTSPPR
jgi:hypothetical protein